MKPKVLIVFNRLVIGGQAVDNIPLAHHLHNDFDILIVHGEKEPDEMEANFLLQKYPSVKIQKLKRLKRSINPIIDVLGFIDLYKLINTFQPVIIHTHGAKIGVFGRLIAIIKGIKSVHTFHGHLFHSYFNSFFTRLMIAVERWFFYKTDAVIALSDTQKNELVSLMGIKDNTKMKVINLGIDYIFPEKSELYRAAFRNQYSLSENDVAIGILGRLVPVKNTPFFIEIITALKKKPSFNKLVFFIIGDGEQKEQLFSVAKTANIAYSEQATNMGNTELFFTSWITDIQEAIDGLDIVVSTSFNEGTPFSLIEAQLCSKPVVAINVGGIKDTFIPNETGILIEGYDTNTFAEKILLLANDSVLRNKMGTKGQQFAAEKFSKQQEVAAIKTLYKSLLN